MVLDAATMSPLGFSPEQAAKAFAGQYEAALTYYDGHPPSTLRVSIHPNGKPLSRFGAPPGIPDGTSYAFRESGGRGALETRGVSEGSSVVLSVDLEFSSEDGRFHEQLQTELRAFDLDFARLEPELALAGESGPGEEDYEISGSFSFDPEGFRSAGVGLYIDVHRDDDSGSTSGWVGNTRRDPSVPDAEPEMYDFAVWGECSLNRLDAGTAACADGGLPVSADGQARAKED
jgi:hypothetical protein